MEHPLVALLLVNISLVAATGGSILYATGLPYPYISPYALAYSYVHHPLVLSNPRELDAAVFQPSIVAATSLDDISADRRDSEEIPDYQSPSEPSTALGEAAPSTAPELPLPLPAADRQPELISSVAEPKALGEPTSQPPASNELKYYHPSSPVTYTIPKPLVWPTASQFHQQDGLGQYNYGYANEHSSKQEFKLLDGITRGAYNYVDAEGRLQTVSYVSDGEGFRVAATNLPQPAVPVEIPDSPEVAAVKAAHLQAQAEAVANVNRANGVTGTDGSVASGGNAVVGCNETSKGGGGAPNEM